MTPEDMAPNGRLQHIHFLVGLTPLPFVRMTLRVRLGYIAWLPLISTSLRGRFEPLSSLLDSGADLRTRSVDTGMRETNGCALLYVLLISDRDSRLWSKRDDLLLLRGSFFTFLLCDFSSLESRTNVFLITFRQCFTQGNLFHLLVLDRALL